MLFVVESICRNHPPLITPARLKQAGNGYGNEHGNNGEAES